jgi:hypothetical protein
MGLKTFRKKANGLKKMRSERFDPLKTSSLSMMKKAISLLVFGHNLGDHWLELM